MASPPHAEGRQPSPRGADPPAGGADPPPGGGGGVRTCGYLRKQKHGHKRFFVLREPSAGLPARLEYYESEKKWRSRSAAKRVIPLDGCLNVNKRADAKHKHLVALYTRDEYFAVAADSEPEQERWYRGLTELMSPPGRADDGSASDSASSLVGFDEASYGVITPVAAAYREVWQVVLKSKGLGQSRHLTGVYRLCLSARTISFVKLTAEVASVSLQLMNIRRCGHSDSFFFMEVGRSAATGPGELWMQADDSVVAQNIHETILEAMKAMKELSEFRPRSKSQSSGTNPISVPVRRHLNHLPPSQTGLARRSRTDSMAATSPVSKLSSCRFRTASEGDGSTARPVSVSPLSPGVHRALLGRSKTLTARPCRTFESSSLQHSKSMSMPVSRSPPPAGGGSPSPVSLSSLPETGGPLRPSSCSASFSGSPSDAGFVSSEEWGSSPGEGRDLRLSLTLLPPRGPTPPAGGDPQGYMLMERQAHRKRTYSLTSPRQQGAPPQPSSASLDEYTLMRATYSGGPRRPLAASPKGGYPEAHGEGGDAGYMPMLPGAAPRAPAPKGHAYMAMSPMCVSAPKQIINPRAHPAPSPPRPLQGGGGSPPSSLEERGYMRMWAGPRLSGDSGGDYLNMSPVDPGLCSPPPPDPRLLSPSADPPPPRQPLWYGPPPPRGPKAGDADQYVIMSLQRQRIEEESSGGPVSPQDPGAPGGLSSSSSSSSCSAPSPLRAPRPEGPPAPRMRAPRPSRLALEALRPLPCMREHPLPAGPRSPGEYIHIAFNGPPGPQPAPLPSACSDYVNVDLSSPRGPLAGGSLSSAPAPVPGAPQQEAWPGEREGGGAERAGQQAGPGGRGSSSPGVPDDYAPMSFTTPPPGPTAEDPPPPPLQRPGSGSPPGATDAFLLGPAPAPLDPNRGAKVIRADPQGRRRHSSETFSSTTTVTPVCPSFAHAAQRHSSASVENVSRSARGSDGSDDEPCVGGSPMCRETSAGFQNGLNYIALNLMEGGLGGCALGGGEGLLRFKTPCGCKGGMNGFSGGSYASMGFKESVAAVKD